MLAVNLVSWMPLAILPGGHVAGIWDMKRWRYRLYSIAGKLISSARRTMLLIPDSAPDLLPFATLIEGASQLRQGWGSGLLAA